MLYKLPSKITAILYTHFLSCYGNFFECLFHHGLEVHFWTMRQGCILFSELLGHEVGVVTKPTNAWGLAYKGCDYNCGHADDWFPGYTSHIIQSLTLAASQPVQVLLDVKWLCGVSCEWDRGEGVEITSGYLIWLISLSLHLLDWTGVIIISTAYKMKPSSQRGLSMKLGAP